MDETVAVDGGGHERINFKDMNFPFENSQMDLKRSRKRICFRGIRLRVSLEQYVCPKCGSEAGTIEQTAAVQKTIRNAYQRALARHQKTQP
jgi:hypothetical protein